MGPSSRSTPNDDFAMLAAIAFVIFLNLSLFPLLSDGDTGWHVAAGRWMIEHRAVPVADPFSFTFAGHQWIAHEWLSELAMALAYGAAGWSGVTLLFAAATTALFLILGIEIRRWLPSLPAFVILLAVFLLLRPYLFARPHLLALPLLAGWSVALLRAREAGRAPPWLLVPLMVFWANMHGSFFFGLALIGPFALEAMLDPAGDRRKALAGWGGFALLSTVAALVTPHGIEGLLFPFQVSTMKTLPLISEWKSASFSRISGFELVLLGFLLFALSRGLRIPAVRLLLLLGLLHLALQHVRHQAILAVVGALLLAEPIARSLAPKEDLPKPGLRAAVKGQARSYLPAAAAMLLILGTIAAMRIAVPLRRPDSANVPMTALAKLPVAFRSQPVFNNYGFGGALIFAGIRPFIDGRADMYGDAFVARYARISGGDLGAWRKAARRWRIRWTILSPSDDLTGLLDREPGWRRVYSDRFAVIHAR